MRKILFALVLVSLIGSCKSDDEFIFEIPYGPLDFTVPAGLSVLNFHQFTIPFDATSILDLASQGASYNEIVPNTAFIESLTNNDHLGFAQDISIRICSEDFDNPNCGTEIFWKNPTEFDESTPAGLWPNENDISAYLEAEDVILKVKFSQLRSTTTQELNLFLRLNFVAR